MNGALEPEESVRAYENSIGQRASAAASHQEEFMNEWINEWANSAKGRVYGFLMPWHHMSEINTHTSRTRC